MAISLLCNNIWPSSLRSGKVFELCLTRNREECCPKSSRTSCQAMHGAVDAEANPAPGNSSTKMGSTSFARDRREPSPVPVLPVKWSLNRDGWQEEPLPRKFLNSPVNYGVVPWIISTSSVDQIMRLTNLPWVVEIPNLENIWILQMHSTKTLP